MIWLTISFKSLAFPCEKGTSNPQQLESVIIKRLNMIYNKVLEQPAKYDFNINKLGNREQLSPINGHLFVNDDERIAFSSQIRNLNNQYRSPGPVPSFEKGGPREKLFFKAGKVKAAIVTCGGLCPGLNTVIKGLVKTLENTYQLTEILGIKYGYKGLTSKSLCLPIKLTGELVDDFHVKGGTYLGSSRGNQDPVEMVDFLCKNAIDILFCIGGDGTLKGAKTIADEITRRDLKIAVVGIPKTIDNDISFVEKTFGFETSVEMATKIISAAHCEAESAENGIGIVKLMGRDSGFIAASSSLANSVVDICLIPEKEFQLEGESGLVASIRSKLDTNMHVVIVVAEGAGQNLFTSKEESRDESGNILNNDIGVFLRDKLKALFKIEGRNVNIKYLDPSYFIRSVPPVATDAIFCYQLAEHAAHAGMAGKTNLVIGHWNNFFTHVPIELATSERKLLDLRSDLWRSLENNF